MGLLHCTLNAHHALQPSTSTYPHSEIILPSTPLSTLASTAAPLPPTPRTTLLTNSATLQHHHTLAALSGSTPPLALHVDPGHAFIAFVRGSDGVMYEMDGGRQGPKALCSLREGEDLLSETALEAGVRAFLRRESGWAEERAREERGEEENRKGVEFSCTVLAERGGE
jgi:ubiquitin carboxyl-terminal hydrolase L3